MNQVSYERSIFWVQQKLNLRLTYTYFGYNCIHIVNDCFKIKNTLVYQSCIYKCPYLLIKK